MITIDGSMGEGGGQILRSSLALSMVTGKPFCMVNIRARRKRPGLLRQHLTAVKAAAEVAHATVKGMVLKSQELTFDPGEIASGEYRFSVGTAGSATLVSQTVLPALMTAASSSTLILEGGTHNPLAPPFDFLQKVYLPLVEKMGPKFKINLERPGFYPAGGGRFRLNVTPVKSLSPLHMPKRGKVLRKSATAMVSNLPLHVARRELKVVGEVLGLHDEELHLEEVTNAEGPGNVVNIEIASENLTEVFTGFGERGVPAEKVAARAAQEAQQYLNSEAAAGRHLADQLLIPLTMAGGGSFSTLPLTRHFHTNAEVIQKFLEVPIMPEQISADQWLVTIVTQ